MSILHPVIEQALAPFMPPEPAAFTQDELIAGDLENNVNKAAKAHQATDARALKLQQQFDNIFNR